MYFLRIVTALGQPVKIVIVVRKSSPRNAYYPQREPLAMNKETLIKAL